MDWSTRSSTRRPMATLSDLPDELLALIVRELTPLPPLPMRNSSATLLDEILAVCRNPGHPDQDLRSIMHVSQRLRAIAQRPYYAYLYIGSAETCKSIANTFLEDARMERAWTDSPARFVQGIVLQHATYESPSTYHQDDDNGHPLGLDILERLLGLVPNLAYLDLGYELEPSPRLLASLASYRLSLRYLYLEITPANYNAATCLLNSVANTLTHLYLFEKDDLGEIGFRPAGLRSGVDLPRLRSLQTESWERDENRSIDSVCQDGWSLPQLRSIAAGMYTGGVLAEELAMRDMVATFGRSLREITVDASWVTHEWLERRLPRDAPNVHTLAIGVDVRAMESPRPPLEGDCPQIRQLILLQTGFEQVWPRSSLDIGRRFFEGLLSKASLPNLERVWWVSARRDAPPMALWAALAADLVQRKVEVIHIR